MKTTAALIVLGVMCAEFNVAQAQAFSSGSDGTYGPMNITADATLDVPPSGVFHCTTVNVAAGRTLRFRRNAFNTPVHILASGDVMIAGRIDVSGGPGNNVVGGLAGPGGFDGGSPGSGTAAPGSGYGPGAGKGGEASISTAGGAGSGAFGAVNISGGSTGKGAVYGNALLIPAIGGSGGGGTAGGPGTGGGGGGGAIVIASNSRIDIPSGGSIYAQGGGSGYYNGGSGGGIRLIAPTVAGGGTIVVNANSAGGFGRVRIDTTDRSQLNLNYGDSASVTSVGTLMMVFPNPAPRLDIIEAAGTAIPEGSGPVILQLPFGSSANRTIKVQAKDFNANVPITVVLTPDHGSAVQVTGTVNNAGANNPASVTLDVTLPVNEQVTVHAYAK